MSPEFRNHLGQPVGGPLPIWSARPLPRSIAIEGRAVHLGPLDPARHARALFTAFAEDTSGGGWTYLPYGPFEDEGAFRQWTDGAAAKSDPLFFTILDAEAAPAGLAALQRIGAVNGVVEVGNIHFAPKLARATGATEAMYLMMRHVFDDLGYRRYEWKCDSHNALSRAAAERLGFRFEGIFRQAIVYKGRNRDTAWYSVIDGEWPALKERFERWLAPENFDRSGRQRKRLQDV
jgi:RimJ/RimL family protein N-acetyltransferase